MININLVSSGDKYQVRSGTWQHYKVKGAQDLDTEAEPLHNVTLGITGKGRRAAPPVTP